MVPALVLTAGLATRLRPLSLVRAKAALPVAGRMGSLRNHEEKQEFVKQLKVALDKVAER